MDTSTKSLIWIGILCIPTVLIAVLVPLALIPNPGPNFSRIATGHYTLYSYAERRTDDSNEDTNVLVPGPFEFLGDDIVSGDIIVNTISKKKYESEGPEMGNLISSNGKKRYSIDISLADNSGRSIEYIPRFTDESDSGNAHFLVSYTFPDTGDTEDLYMELNAHRKYSYWGEDGEYNPLNGKVDFLEIIGPLDGRYDSSSDWVDIDGESYLISDRRAIFVLDGDLDQLPEPPISLAGE